MNKSRINQSNRLPPFVKQPKNEPSGMKLLSIMFTLLLIGCATTKMPSLVGSDGVEKIALLSMPFILCYGYEQSAPHAFVEFAFQINGEIQYFRTKTTCSDFNLKKDEHLIYGERVTLFGDGSPTAVRRENGMLYQILQKTQISYSFGGYSINVYQNMEHIKNPHPDLVIEECRLIIDSKKRDHFLSMQAALQKNYLLCNELSDSSMCIKCNEWIDNIENGRVNK
jgi:hypothetical protein